MAAAQQGRTQALLGLVFGAIAATVLLWPPRLADADGPWLSGEPLRDALSRKISVVWSNIPVRQALEGLCKSQQIGLLIDRRIDPDRKIELSLEDVPLADGLQQIASRLGVGTAMLGPVVYFGPVATADQLRTLSALRAQDAEKLPPAARARWTKQQPWKWDDLATPRDLLAALGQEAGVTMVGMEQVPADLWAQADLPPLTLPERLTLLLAQFDLTYEPSADGATVRLVAVPENPLLECRYPVTGSAEEVAAKVKQLKLSPHAEIEVRDGAIEVRGKQEDHDVVEQFFASQSPAVKKTHERVVVGEARKVYSLQVELPVGQLLQSLGPRMGLEIHIDKEAIAAAGKSLETKVKLDVKEAGADELLHAVLDPAGLTFTRKDNAVDVRPKP